MQKVWEAVEPMLAVFILAGIGWVVAEVIQFALRTVTRRVGEASSAQVFFTGVVRRGHVPTQLLLVLIGARFGLVLSPGVDGWRPAVLHGLLVAIIVAGGWLVAAVLQAVADTVKARFRIDVPDNLAARRAHTQVTILRRLAITVIALLTSALALTTFEQVRTIGATVLASAGVAGVIAGLAAQSMLGNVFAGLQLVFGNALHIDDVVVVEGQWGRIEEITLAYVVVNIWDQRRLILPTSYFTNTPFTNWTRQGSEILGTVELSVDWTVPVPEMRAELERYVKEHPLWDGRVVNLQVTDAVGTSATVRALISAADGGKAWTLRCDVREHLIEWVRTHHPHALPRMRADVSGQRLAATP